eukprot:6464863-Amphidinium_carterae.1
MYVDDIAIWVTGERAFCRSKMEAVRNAIHEWSQVVGLGLNHKTGVWGRPPAESKFMRDLFPEHSEVAVVKDLGFDLICSSRTRLVQPAQEKNGCQRAFA